MHTKKLIDPTSIGAVRLATQVKIEEKPSMALRLKRIFSRPDMTLSDWERLEFRKSRPSSHSHFSRGL